MSIISAPSLPAFSADTHSNRAGHAAARLSTILHALLALPARARRRLRHWDQRMRERAFLASLEEFQLGDMGMTLDQRNREAGKPFWQA